MTDFHSAHTVKKLAIRYVMENIDYRKRCQYLQEIISMGRENKVWHQALNAFFDMPFNNFSLRSFSKN
jgi:hypothetical protein